jgi:hypothetical protein
MMRDSRFLRRAIAFFLPLAVLFTMASGLVYAAGEQMYRSSANDPQYALAVDAAHRLDTDSPPHAVASGSPVDLAASYASHITIYGSNHVVLASTARLNGSVPSIPSNSQPTCAMSPSRIASSRCRCAASAGIGASRLNRWPISPMKSTAKTAV